MAANDEKAGRGRSLRTILTGSIVALTLVSLIGGVALVLVTNSLGTVIRQLSQAVESVRISEETEIGLLVHERLQASLARAQTERAIRRNLRAARRFAGTEEEVEVLRESREAIEAYFAATAERPVDPERVDAALERAFRAVERLADINVAQSQEARAEAAMLDRFADFISLGAVVVFFAVVPLILWWLNTRAFRPSFAIGQAMARFARGDWSARAPATGPEELREMAENFNDMAERLAEQRESQAAFLAGVAHDLRTPLAALKMSATSLPPDRPLPSEQHIRRTLAVNGRQVDRLARMVDDLLDTARIDAGELALSIERHDARELARSAVDLFADSPHHRLELEIPDRPVWLDCDSGRIEQVLNNLVSNAIKYSPEGGEVRVSVERRGETARLSVSDQGVGITREDRARLFLPFRRIKHRGQAVPGIGLGLFVSRRIVEAHEGTIEIESKPGRGSTFTVSLPLASGSATRD